MKKLLLLASVLPFGGLAAKTKVKNDVQKPNIVLLLADDLGYGDLSCFGSRKITTPNIDNMAAEGVKFTQFYAGSAVCTPTRVSIITGQYPLRYNVTKHFNDKEMFLQRGVQTIPKMLKKQGYVTKHVGKWHLGGLNEKHIKDRKNSMPGPMEHGFDHYLAMIEDPLYRAPAMRERRLYKDGAKYLVRDEKIIKPIKRHWTDVKTDEACSFIKECSKGEKPFFLNLWFDTPHAPYEKSEARVMKPYKNRAKGDDYLYRGMVSNLDKSVGRVLKALKKHGLDKNTIVILTSDNGPAYQGSPGMFKGRKVDFHEGGIRVPMIVWWPGKVKAGKVTDELAHTNDFFPTFAKLSKCSSTKEYKLDGVDITDFILNKSNKIERGTVFWHINHYGGNGNYAVTVDKRPQPVATEIARNGKWKLLAHNGKPLELFNLEEDPYERWNLMKHYPKIAQKLTKELNDWLKEPRMPIEY